MKRVELAVGCDVEVGGGTLVRDLYHAAEAAAGKPLKLLAGTAYLRATSTVSAAGLQDGQHITAVTHPHLWWESSTLLLELTLH